MADNVEAMREVFKGWPRPKRMALLKALLDDLKPEVVGTQEASDLLGVEKARIGKWRKDGRMPDPIGVCSLALDPEKPGSGRNPASGPVWLRDDIEAMREQVDSIRRKPRVSA